MRYLPPATSDEEQIEADTLLAKIANVVRVIEVQARRHQRFQPEVLDLLRQIDGKIDHFVRLTINEPFSPEPVDAATPETEPITA